MVNISNLGNPSRNPFGWNGRLNWYSYFINMVIILALYFGGDYLRYWAYLQDFSVLESIGYIIIFFSIFRGFALTTRRFHDFEISGRVMLYCYIAFLLFSYGSSFTILGGWVGVILGPLLLFYPGQESENKYGPVPGKKIAF